MPSTKTIGPKTTVTGAEFRDFYQNHWPGDWYVEEMPYEAEDEQGNWVLPDDAVRPLDWFGVAFYQGRESSEWKPGIGRPMHELYAEAMGSKSTQVTVSFKIDPDKADELVKAAEAVGATLI